MILSSRDKHMLEGHAGPATAMAMRIVADMGQIQGAEKLISVSAAHIDGCLYHGASGVAFADRLLEGEARVCIPSSLNVGAMDLLRPAHVKLAGKERELAIQLMNAYVSMGCIPSWTCAPYQAGYRPKKGEDIAWAESNAVVFANSVLGARTNRYGDFMDICCALTGRAPFVGLHVPENRYASVEIDTRLLSASLKRQDAFYAVLGSWLGRAIGSDIAVISGLSSTVNDDQLKAMGASAASSGGVALFHIAGVTPEAETKESALNFQPPEKVWKLTAEQLISERDRLSTDSSGQLDVVAVGSPHFSVEEFRELLRLLDGRHCRVPIVACTGRHVLRQLEYLDYLPMLNSAGVELVLDTCVVVTPILASTRGVLMTNSGKFAHYSPSLIGHEVIFGNLSDCVNSAVEGTVVRDESGWK